jgi:signal transduction histidine kinase/CheY-like chemotaxis protein
VVMDAAGVVRYCNARADAILGMPARSLLGRPLDDAILQIRPRLVDADAVCQGWRRALENPGGRPSLEMTLSGAPGCDVQLQVFPVAGPGGLTQGVGVVLRDVTAERDLTRTKDELVSVVSHELRTPLASVVGFAELLRTRELDESQRQQFLTVIVEEGRRLTAMINDFLDLQRMESGRQEINPRAVGLRTLLEQAVALAGEDSARPIRLTIREPLPPVRADEDRILQVLTNLLSNARKYSPQGGAVELEASERDGQVTVSVRDRGLGIPREAQSRLFEKFYRVDNSDRRQIKGTGLGLTISRKIVEAHGGRIWAESEGVGLGSRFSFTLPMAVIPRRRGDVLVVEDDAGFARLLAAELADRGLTSVWAASVEDALEQIAVDRPRAVMLDLLLPGAEGDVFLRRLRASGGGDIPVVVVTVKDLTAMEKRTFEDLGVVAVLRKGSGVAMAASDALATALDVRAGREVGVSR